MSGCPFSGAAAAVGPESSAQTSVSRRRVLVGAAGLAAVPVLVRHRAPTAAAQVVPTPVATPAPAPTPAASAALAKLKKGRALKGAHGVGDPRGSDIALRFGRDREARFGVMFKRLPAYNPPDALLTALAVKMNDGKAPLNDVKDSDVAFDIETTPAGYIYLGQFIDHDMTLDKTPLTQQKQDPRAMVNFDTPKFDLGSVYGKGPTGSPELYDPDKPGYLLVNPHDELFDLPRDGVGAAYLGDPRNDENLIVAQLHVVFLRMHNKLMDTLKDFQKAQQQLRWTYQYLIVNDFLPRIVGQDVVNSLIRRRGTGPIQFTGKLYQPRNVNKPYMPVEYSGAAYRFGHSMIRAEYEVQDGHTVPISARTATRTCAATGRSPQPVDRLELLLRDPRHEHPGRPEHGAADRHAVVAAAAQAAVDGRRPDGGGDRRAWPSATCCAVSAWACPPARTSPPRWGSSR